MSLNLAEAISHLTEADPILARVINSTDELPTFEPHTNYYQALVESIISQQLSVKAAASIEKRFYALFDGIPSPEELVATDIERLRGAGLSRPKARYIQDLGTRVIDGTVVFETLSELTNDQIVEELTKVKGIGEWTVHMFLMFCMGRLDVLPVGDLGIRNGIQKLYKLPALPDTETVRAVAAQNGWSPYASVASWYIWHSLDNAPPVSV
jgi:DNA-3-methyladenine glycosylase II